MEINLENLKSVDFSLENCDCVTAPADCFKQLKIKATKEEGLTDEELIELETKSEIEKEEILRDNEPKYWLDVLECEIKNNESITLSTWEDNTVSPFKRLFDENDITQVWLTYQDGHIEKMYIDLPYSSQYNTYQTNDLVDKNTLHIDINVPNNMSNDEAMLQDGLAMLQYLKQIS